MNLDPNREFFLDVMAASEQQRELILGLPKNTISGLRIREGKIDGDFLRQVVDNAGLKILRLDDCQLADDAFLDLPPALALTQFRFSSELTEDSLPDLAAWMRSCPKLHVLAGRTLFSPNSFDIVEVAQ